MSILFSFHWCCHTPPVWPPSSPHLLLLDALPDTCNPLTPWTARQCTGRVVEAGVDTISSSPFPRLRMWTLSASVLVKRLFFSVRTDSALFRYLAGDEPGLWGGVWSTRWHQLPLFPWRWGPCHSPGLTRPDTRGPLRGETRSPAETEIHYKYSIIFLWKKQLTSKLEVCWFTVKPARAHPIIETSRSLLNLYSFPGLGLGGLNGMFSSLILSL